MRKKDARSLAKAANAAGITAAAVIPEQSSSPSDTVAVVLESTHRTRLVIDDPLVEVRLSLENRKEKQLLALIDTGSPVSFIKAYAYYKYLEPYKKVTCISSNLKNSSNEPLDILGKLTIDLSLQLLEERNFEVNLFVINTDAFQGDIILGREFLTKEKLTLVYNPAAKGDREKINLFANLPLCVDDNRETESLENIMDKHEVDFGPGTKARLQKLVIDISRQPTITAENNYTVQVRLKDDSVYSFAPRRFAKAERDQIREITDDLLNRHIIKPSVSPYCARIVPVRKKNGEMQLCVDLRPLNSRVIKQKYPFPIIEDCLSRLANKKVFTLLNFKDSFHQIRVHEDSTKYFSFATPDGQFEFVRLSFGYCEAPAEFQKRLIQILNPLIRDDKVIIYIDDILIPSETVDENLRTLSEVIIIFKRYGFELNLAKCKFLRKNIEFLGYIISAEGMTLSPRHTEAVRNYAQPRDRL